MARNDTMKRNAHTRRKKRLAGAPILLALGGVLMVGLALLVLSGSAPRRAVIEKTGGASLRVDQEIVDLGEMQFNQPARVSFELTNVGDATLRFTQPPYIEVVEGC